ncbi:MAG TPA: two-component system response regulator [Candidatus Wallbacteria bacterium]|nr:two-component system response regulator [Candidatus Wallbacteria bacterium]
MSDLKLLVVEDEATSALIMKLFFGSLGYDIGEVAATGEEAVLRGIKEKPDIVFMDIQLAGKIDGIEAAEEIISQSKNTSIVFVTAYSDEETVARAKKLNPVDYILKPFNLNDLKKIIDSVVSGLQLNKR